MSNANRSMWLFPRNEPGKVLGWETVTGKYLENKAAGSAMAAELIDDDTFATATAANVPSAESVKAYADTKLPLVSARADAEAYSPDAAPDFLSTAGYTTAGDGGGALYKKVASEPSHAGKFSITLSDTVTVVWYELAASKITPQMFGGVADGADTLEDGAKVRGDYVAGGTAYAENDLIWNGAIGSRLGYRATQAFVSTDFASDLASGYMVLGAFTGANNTAAFASMVACHEATGIRMLVPEGQYRLLNPSSTIDSAYLTLTGSVFDLILEGTLLIDEDGTAGQGYNLFKTDTFDSNTSHVERELFRITGGGAIRGRWSHKPGGNAPNSRLHILAISGYKNVILDDFECTDIPGSFSRADTLDGAYANNVWLERIAKGGLRFRDTYDVRITNNKLRWINDDCIDVHAANSKVRGRIYIAGNTRYDCEQIIALGAREISVIGNPSTLDRSGAIFVGARVTDEGDNAALNIVVAGNSVTDPVMSSADGATLSAHDGTQAAIAVGSVPASWLAGNYNGTSINDPLSDSYYDNVDLDTTNVPQGGSIEVYGNPIKRTRQAVANFSDYGDEVPFLFDDDGWINPAVAVSNMVPNGVALLSDIENFRVDLNVSGFREGAGVLFRFLPTTEANRNWSFRNGRVSGVVRDCLDGMRHSFWSGASQVINFQVHFRDFHCDLDPFHVSAARTSGTAGSWNSAATETQKNYGLRLAFMRGFSVQGCSFKNMYAPVYGDAAKDQGYYRDNLIYGVRAASGYSASNFGVGDMPRSNDEFDLAEFNSVPSAGAGTYDHFSKMVRRFGEVTLADDTATSIIPPRSQGIVRMTSNANSMVAFFAYDVVSGVINAVGTSGSSATLSTVALAGTTGTDARVNYAAVNDGKIYIENRIGSSRTIRYAFQDG